MAAVLVDTIGAVALRNAVRQLRNDFKVPVGKVMSWKQDAKNHDRRRRAAEVLSAVPNLKVCYVFAVKKELDPGSYLCDPQLFYNYIAFKMYRSICWAAQNWYGSDSRLWTRYGHVRNHDHTATEQYIRARAAMDPKIPLHMEQALNWVSADKYLESQAADLYGGFLKAAIWPSGEFGYTEPSYLRSIWHQLGNSEVCAVPLGIMSMPRNDIVCEMNWFPCDPCPQANRPSRASAGRST